MVGEGPERIKAQRYVKRNQLRNKVLFFGKSNEINELLCYSDIFILPSEKESFGLAALEAMIHKVPVISTNAGGLSEVNINGISGFLSEVGDIDNMAKNTIRILSSPSTRKKFQDGAYKQAIKFDISKIIPLYESVYTRVLKSFI